MSESEKEMESAMPRNRSPRGKSAPAGGVAKKKAVARRSPARRKPAAGAEGVAAPRSISAEERVRMISDAAYYRAEARGFLGGDPERDWLEAEAEIDALLLQERSKEE